MFDEVIIADVVAGILLETRFTFIYTDKAGVESDRAVTPWAIERAANKSILVHAWDHEREQFRSFDLKRIRNANRD